MSGERVLAFFQPKKMSPLEARFGIESDRRLYGCMGMGWVFGIAFAAYALTIEPGIYPRTICEFGPPDTKSRPEVPIRIIIPEDAYHHPIKQPQYAKHPPKPGTPGSHAPKPTSPHPSNTPGQLAAGVLGSKSGKTGLTAYDLMATTVKNLDLDHLTEFATLTRTSASRIGGRPGKQNNAYNEGYDAGGTGGKDGVGIEMPKWTAKRIESEPKAPSNIGKPVEIDQFQNTTTRSTASILAVIRSHSPGLRHVYNSFLKLRPGLAGKITLRFAIAPSGQVVDVGLAGSTTSAPDFDAQVVQSVMAWRFEPVKAVGNDFVTVPFNFSE
jgi:TonB family protein